MTVHLEWCSVLPCRERDMEIRETNRDDLEEILKIYESAQQYMLENGNPHQWVNGYPDEEIILMDIENKHHFVCVDDNRIVGCFVLIEGDDPTYKEIFKGQWLDNNPYAVIHRAAVLEHGKGIGSKCIEWCFSRHKNIRVDTHKDNTPMQRLLIKKGFQYCGVIYTRWGDEGWLFRKH
jgi:RimJ/RimL family protein N-acetyltransferase